MDDNNLLMIVLAFVVGFMLQGMMKNMCGGRLLEGVSVYTQEWGEKCASPFPPYCKDNSNRNEGTQPLLCGLGLPGYAECSIKDKNNVLKAPSDCKSGCDFSGDKTVTCPGGDRSTCTATTTLV